jgi:glycosyltransferase involved in cell wall biosynthesis
MNEIFFSVIIPAYNSEQYLAETVESVLAQKNSKFEVIIIDDGSTDETISIAESFGDNLRIAAKENGGVSTARNYGVQIARGNYVAFLDADDIWEPEKLEKQAVKLRKGYKMVYSNRWNIGEKGDLPDLQSDIEEMYEGDIFLKLLLGNFITNSSVVINKMLFDSLNGFNVNLLTCEDWDLWMRFAAVEKIGLCPEPLVKYRFHAGGKSRNYLRQAVVRERIISSMLGEGRGKNLSFSTKRKIWAYTYRTSGWAAARSGDWRNAMKLYWKSLTFGPFEAKVWYDVARVIAGRA